ncbi:thiamine diphosphokinase [Thalassovita sp.]|uniref:thiamine diphosphokinase n=1 Tax=Thalassovita sp. TaxID=1979401 RepID=UPI0029DE6748|nr:thiamine diphosphokinase [Thalassovita sp.]
MDKPIFTSSTAVTLVGAGGCTDAVLRLAMAHAPRIVAADGGGNVALGHGVAPDAVIGDMDSLSDNARRLIPSARLHRIAEQDSTDFDKALRNVDAPLVIGVGFNGSRLDHTLACFNTMVRWPGRRCLLVMPGQLVFLCPPRLDLPLAPGTLVSLFPMGKVRGRSEGLEWPIDGLEFAPDGRVGTSNRVMGAVRLWMDAPRMLVILPQEALGPTVQSLLESEAWS